MSEYEYFKPGSMLEMDERRREEWEGSYSSLFLHQCVMRKSNEAVVKWYKMFPVQSAAAPL